MANSKFCLVQKLCELNLERLYLFQKTVHRFRCIGGRPGKVLIHYTPGGIEGFFREAGMPATNDGPAPSLDIAEITRTEVFA